MNETWQQASMLETVYGGVAPFQKHSSTSKGAAIALSESRRATLRALVLRYLLVIGDIGATDEQIQIFLHMNGNTERPRRCELLEAGLIADSGARRLTKSGLYAVVWKAV